MAPSEGRRVGIVGRGGGIGVNTTDICEREGLFVPEFTTETKEKLSKLTPQGGGSIVRNPVEIGLGRFGISEHYVEALSLVDADPNIDLTITFLDPEQYLEHIKDDWVEGAEKSLIEASKQVKKPLIVVFKPGISSIVFEWNRQLQSACHKAGLPVYKSLETAIKAASKHIEYNEFKSSISCND
jgi:acyl-CoA synthetase (NDP forming)